MDRPRDSGDKGPQREKSGLGERTIFFPRTGYGKISPREVEQYVTAAGGAVLHRLQSGEVVGYASTEALARLHRSHPEIDSEPDVKLDFCTMTPGF